jgi:ABC-type branched-subunit amino acid transport system substrate-binding protein
MRRYRKRVAFFACLLGAVSGLAACSSSGGGGSQASKAPINVGLLMGLTSATSGIDRSIDQASLLAIQQQNAKGGIKGRKLVPFVIDTSDDPSKAITAFNKLYTQDHVSVIIGPVDSDSALALVPYMLRQGYNVPLLTSATDPELFHGTAAYLKWSYGIGIDSQATGYQITNYLVQSAHSTKLGSIYADIPYGQEGSGFSQKRAGQLNVPWVGSQAVGLTTTDVLAQMTKLKDDGVNGLADWLAGVPATFKSFLQSSQQLNWYPNTMVEDILLSITDTPLTDPALKNTALLAECNTQSPAYQAYAKAVAPRLNFVGAAYSNAAVFYSGIQALFHAMSLAADPANPNDIRMSLNTNVSNFPSFCGDGHITLSASSHVFVTTQLVEHIVDGKEVPLGS